MLSFPPSQTIHERGAIVLRRRRLSILSANSGTDLVHSRQYNSPPRLSTATPLQQRPNINSICQVFVFYSIFSSSLHWDIFNNLDNSRTREINNLRRERSWRNTIHANTMRNQANLVLFSAFRVLNTARTEVR